MLVTLPQAWPGKWKPDTPEAPAVAGLPSAGPSSPGGTPHSEPLSAELLAAILRLTGLRLCCFPHHHLECLSASRGQMPPSLRHPAVRASLYVFCFLPLVVFSWELLRSQGSLISSATCCPGDVTAEKVTLFGEAGQTVWLSQCIDPRGHGTATWWAGST